MTSLLIRSAFVAVAICLPLTAAAENTVEDWSWQVDHFETFGIWQSVCDHRDDDGLTLRRCYVSYVDVFAPRPKFAAAFVFLTAAADGTPNFEFRFERGTRFDDDGFSLRRDGNVIWTLPTQRCRGSKCVIGGADAERLVALMDEPGQLRFTFTDRYDRRWERVWDTKGFGTAVDDFRSQAAERGLIARQ